MILFFVLLHSLFPSQENYQGFQGHPATGSRAYVTGDILPGRKGRVVIFELTDYRGRRCSSSRDLWLTTGDRSLFRGEILILHQKGWESEGYFLSREAEVRSKIIPWVMSRFEKNPQGKALMNALILGRTDREISRMFRNCGLSFLLALSGMHITLIIELLNILLLFYLPKNSQGPITALLLLFFLWITGIRHSLIRAFIMFVIRLIQEYRGRPDKALPLLLLSAAIHLLIFPEAIYSLSFQLSYLAMVGIFFFTPLIRLLFPPWFPGFLADALSLSLGAQTAVNPLLLILFSEIHPASLVSVLLFAPLITLLLWSGLLYLPLGYLPIVNRFLQKCIALLSLSIDHLTKFFSKIPPLRTGNGGNKSLIWLSLIPPLVFMGYYLFKGALHFGKTAEPELRFPYRDKNTAGYDGSGTTEAVGAEFPHQSRCQTTHR